MIRFLGSLHPALVHFPIGLILVAGLAEGLFLYRRDERLAFTARFLLGTGAAFAVVAAVLGFAAATGESYAAELQRNFAVHRILGVAVPVMAFLTWGLAESAARTRSAAQRAAYRSMLVLTMLAVAVAGYLGGTLVFGKDHE